MRSAQKGHWREEEQQKEELTQRATHGGTVDAPIDTTDNQCGGDNSSDSLTSDETSGESEAPNLPRGRTSLLPEVGNNGSDADSECVLNRQNCHQLNVRKRTQTICSLTMTHVNLRDDHGETDGGHVGNKDAVLLGKGVLDIDGEGREKTEGQACIRARRDDGDFVGGDSDGDGPPGSDGGETKGTGLSVEVGDTGVGLGEDDKESSGEAEADGATSVLSPELSARGSTEEVTRLQISDHVDGVGSGLTDDGTTDER